MYNEYPKQVTPEGKAPVIVNSREEEESILGKIVHAAEKLAHAFVEKVEALFDEVTEDAPVAEPAAPEAPAPDAPAPVETPTAEPVAEPAAPEAPAPATSA